MTKRQESGFNWRGVEFGPQKAQGHGPLGEPPGACPHLLFLSPSVKQQVVRWTDEISETEINIPNQMFANRIKKHRRKRCLFPADNYYSPIIRINLSHFSINPSLNRALGTIVHLERSHASLKSFSWFGDRVYRFPEHNERVIRRRITRAFCRPPLTSDAFRRSMKVYLQP